MESKEEVIQRKLFDLPINPPAKQEHTCRTCIHRFKHQYGKMFYCEMQKQKGTAYGYKKIKAGDPACPLYKSNKEK